MTAGYNIFNSIGYLHFSLPLILFNYGLKISRFRVFGQSKWDSLMGIIYIEFLLSSQIDIFG